MPRTAAMIWRPCSLPEWYQPSPILSKPIFFWLFLYMRREDYNKAGRSLYKILQIDKSNSKALYYMSIVKQNTGRADAEKRKMVKAFSPSEDGG